MNFHFPAKSYKVLFAGFLGIVLLVFVFIWQQGLERNELELFSIAKNSGNEGARFDSEEYKFPGEIKPQGLNLIFYADQYPSWEEFESDIVQLMDEVRKVEPFRSYNTYNIYGINPKNGAGICLIKVKDERKPVLRCDEKINTYLNNIPVQRFKLVVLSRQDFQSWANVMRLGNSGIFFSLPSAILTSTDKKTFGILFLHMMGHAFGLKDEETMVLAKHDTAVLRPNGPNCAPDETTAQVWWGDLARQYTQVGYFKGCSGDANYIRPTESSLMNLNDLSNFVPTFQPVSERYLSRILKYCFSPPRKMLDEDKYFFKLYPEFKECIL